MKYRAEIDGLRAVAVLVVMLFHAGFTSFKGGFVGVDVFFVISGFLITSIILQQQAEGTFSIAHFYERRARRILPILFLVLAVSIVFAWCWLLPDAYRSFFNSLTYLSFFSSNFYFLNESGYFDNAAELKPLLHTWSLSVEEQFYIVYPLMLMALWRVGHFKKIAFIFAILVISLSYADSIATSQEAKNFFMIYSRCWELCIGAMCAFILHNSTNKNLGAQWQANLLSTIGLLLILLAVFLFDKNTPFPSFYALLPTIGAAMIILFATEKTVVANLLQLKPVVLVGLISYGAYLWHQPIFAFARHRMLLEPSQFTMLGLLLLSLVLSYFSWRFVERPFRNNQNFSRTQIFSASILGLMLFAGVGLFAQNYANDQRRVNPFIQQIVSAKYDRANTPEDCFTQTLYQDGLCIIGSKDKVVGAIIGDSHALAISHSLGKKLAKDGVGLKFLASAGCPPALNVYRIGKQENCVAFNQANIHYILNSKNIKYVVMVSRWTLNLEAKRFDNLEGGREYKTTKTMDVVINGKQIISENEEIRKENIAKQYQATIHTLLKAGKKVILVYPIPELGWDLPNYAAKLALHNHLNLKISENSKLLQQKTSTSYALYLARNKRTIEALDSAGLNQNLFRVFPEKVFCNNELKERCISISGNQIYYFDDNHLTNAGADLITQQVKHHIFNGN